VGHDLLACPGSLVVAKIEDALDESGGLPPTTQMVQECRLASSTHASNEQDVAAGKQLLLDLENVQITAHEAIGGLGRSVTLGVPGVVAGRLFGAERTHTDLLRLVLVDYG